METQTVDTEGTTREFIGYTTNPPQDEALGSWVSSKRNNRLYRAPEDVPLTRGTGANPTIFEVKLTLPNGAYFSVEGDKDQSEGRGGRIHIGNFLDYWNATQAATGRGVQGSFGYIYIMMPCEKPLTVVDENGDTIVFSTSLSYTRNFPDDQFEYLRIITD